MSPAELLAELVALAEAVGLRVRRIRGAAGAEGEPAAASGVVRIRGEVWIVLSQADSLEERIAAVAGALGREASERLEGRYLPPALRDRIERESESPGGRPVARGGPLP